MLIAQLTDCHIVEPGGVMADRIDSAAGLRRAVDLLNGIDPQPDLVVATGDLVNDGRPAQYDHLVSILCELTAPLIPIPGNHDDRTEMRQRFAQLPAGAPSEPIDFVVDDHDIRLICLDTMIPGHNDGRVTSDQMAWLDRHLAADRERPTVIIQHHPPFLSGIPWMDAGGGLAGAELEARVLSRYDHVEAVLCGHLHRPIHRRFGGTVASSWPSTAVQLALEFQDGQPKYTDEPGAIALHEYSNGALTSHLVPLVDAVRWIPSWADADHDEAL
jgi:3',5'-cyclic AMP phosphodiesterase CpdA